jgi:hypothetical protein
MDTLRTQAPPPSERPSSISDAPTQVALAEPSSFTASSASTLVKIGDSWTYDLVEGEWLTRRVDTVTITVTGIDGDQIRDRVTRAGFRSYGATRSFKAGGFDATITAQETELPGKYYLMEFSPYNAAADVPVPGKEWSAEADVSVLVFGSAHKVHTTLRFRAMSEERVRVPAGEYTSVRVQVRSDPITVFLGGTISVQLECVYWYSRQLRRVVKMTRQQSMGSAHDNSTYGFELTTMKGNWRP